MVGTFSNYQVKKSSSFFPRELEEEINEHYEQILIILISSDNSSIIPVISVIGRNFVNTVSLLP